MFERQDILGGFCGLCKSMSAVESWSEGTLLSEAEKEVGRREDGGRGEGGQRNRMTAILRDWGDDGGQPFSAAP